jgi:hypothetical protein
MTASIRPGVRLSIVRPGLRLLFGRSLIPYLLRCMSLLLADAVEKGLRGGLDDDSWLLGEHGMIRR